MFRTLPVGPFVGTVLRLSVCIPRPCTTEQAMTSFLYNLTSVGFRYFDDFCRLPNDKPWVPADYITMQVYFRIIFLNILLNHRPVNNYRESWLRFKHDENFLLRFSFFGVNIEINVDPWWDQ